MDTCVRNLNFVGLFDSKLLGCNHLFVCLFVCYNYAIKTKYTHAFLFLTSFLEKLTFFL